VKSNLLFVLDKTALIHACFNGGDCVVKERVDSSEEVYYQCECDPTKSVYWVIHMLASKFCEHASTIVCCDKNTHGTSFCVNDGRCKDKTRTTDQT
jgi:hypothetical protein